MTGYDNHRGIQAVGIVSLAAAALSLFAVVFRLPFFCRADTEGPPLTNLRYDEDYSYLRNPEARSGQWWEPLKFIPLTERSYLTLGSELRLRSETITNDNWGLGKDDGYLWFRLLPYVDLHAFESFRLFGQLIMAEAVDR